MDKAERNLDKSFASPTVEGYGTVTIRVVVLRKSTSEPPPEEGPADAEPDELLPEKGDRPVSTFLEEPKRGRQCCVFLINGQRQHAWDYAFIVRDLGLKYLRNRMLVVVDVDGLHPEAVAELMQGTRHQFYEGKVYEALAARVIATLKDDPDLKRLEEEAEDDVSSLQAGDEAVKAQLDQLIQEHHDQAGRVLQGHSQPGDESWQSLTDGSLSQVGDVVVAGDSSTGTPADGPFLLMRPDVSTIRLRPDETRRVTVSSKPEACWSDLENLTIAFDPPITELRASHMMQITGAEVSLTFDEPADFDEDEYPIDTTLRAAAAFKGFADPRLLERRVVVNRSRTRPPKPPKPLLEVPTFLRVTSRQPIKVVPGGPDVHVKLRWDGKDELTVGTPPLWAFDVRCEAAGATPNFFATSPVDGRFEVLIQSSPALKPGEQLKFTVDARGTDGKTLTTGFLACVVEPVTPRRVEDKPPGGAQRRPPYQLLYIRSGDWSQETCWDGAWTGDDSGSFESPNERTPLTIFVNQDMDILVAFRDSLVARRLAESTIEHRVNRYTAHVAFHLYQMYLKKRECESGAKVGAIVDAPTDDQMRDEIRRVANTLIKLMQVSQ